MDIKRYQYIKRMVNNNPARIARTLYRILRPFNFIRVHEYITSTDSSNIYVDVLDTQVVCVCLKGPRVEEAFDINQPIEELVHAVYQWVCVQLVKQTLGCSDA